MSSTKLAFLTEVTDAYTPYQGAGSYEDMIKTKMEGLVREAYPWLGDFTLAVVDSDSDKSYACATGTLRGFSSGYAVEFPVFYLDGDILDIPTFVLPERKLMLPFDESFYRIITSTLNNSDDLGLVRERDDISDALVNALADSDYHDVSEVIKMGSFSRIASFLPRHMLRSYAKTACGKCPELIRDFYSALKLSLARAHVKTAAAADTAKLMFKEEDNMPFDSIVTPVFLSEAEAKELDSEGTETEVVKICDDCFVLPQANNKLSLTNLPSAYDIAKSFGQDFEYMSPGEWIALALSELKRKAFEPFVSICPSSRRDFWVAPVLSADNDGSYTLCSPCHEWQEYDDEFRKLYDLARNDLGGEYATFEKANRRPFNEKDREFMERAMVFYFPKYAEKREYLSDILSSPLSVDHGISKLIATEPIYIPVMTSDNKFALISLASSRSYSLRSKDPKVVRRDGKAIYNFTDDDNQVCVKIVSDSKTGYIKSIVYRADYAPDHIEHYNDDKNKYVTLEFDDKLKTFDPYKYVIDTTENGFIELKAIDKKDRNIIIDNSSRSSYRDPLNSLRSFTHQMYDPRWLDNDFVLNGLGTKRSKIDVGLPCTEIAVNRDGKTVVSIPRPEHSLGPKVIRYTYTDPEKAVQAMAHLGIEPEDLSDAYGLIKAEADHLSSANLNGFTKFGFTMSPAVPAEAPALSSDAILQQAAVVLQNVQETQEQMRQDNELRSRMLDTQLQLVNEKLDNIEQLQAVLEDAVAGGSEPVEEVPQPESADGAEIETEELPPEVIETLVSVALDPSTAEANDMGPEEVEMLQAAAQGDEEAAGAVGLTGKNYQLFLQLYHENIDQMNYDEGAVGPQGETGPEPNQEAAPEMTGEAAPAEQAPEEAPSEDDIETLAQILVDPKAAKKEMDPEMVDDLLRAVLGDEAAANRIGITVAIAKQADARADELVELKEQEEMKAQAEDNINQLAQLLADPNAAQDVDQAMLDALMKAVQGDEEAAEQIGTTVAEAQAAAFRAEQMSGEQQPAEGEAAPEGQAPEEAQTAGQPSEEGSDDIDTLTNILLDEEGSRQQLGDEMVDALLQAVQGDESAAESIGITVADAQAAAFRAQNQAEGGEEQPQEGAEAQQGAAPAEGGAEQQGGELSEEDMQMIAQILADPEGAKQQYDESTVDAMVAAAQGDEEAAGQLGLTVEQVQQAAQMAQQMGGGEAGAEGQPMEGQEGGEQQPQTPQEAGAMLKQNFDQATQLVEAYLDPSKVEEYGISTEDLGTCTLVLRSPDAAMRAGVPGEQVQAISDAYKMITGKSVYQSAEQEFENGAGNIPVAAPNLTATKTAIPEDKAFEEYSKPLAQTSALLDLLPKVKTAKLFFKNADAFREMLTTLGEILINLQINSVHYKESFGNESFKKLLTRVRKMYEDFGATVLEMYSLDKD